MKRRADEDGDGIERSASKRARLNGADSPRERGWLEAGSIGLFVHWGPYAVPAFDSVASARTRRIGNGSEWYLKRLLTTGTSFRPCSGWRETQEHHRNTYGSSTSYDDFRRQFRQITAKPDPLTSLSGATAKAAETEIHNKKDESKSAATKTENKKCDAVKLEPGSAEATDRDGEHAAAAGALLNSSGGVGAAEERPTAVREPTMAESAAAAEAQFSLTSGASPIADGREHSSNVIDAAPSQAAPQSESQTAPQSEPNLAKRGTIADASHQGSTRVLPPLVVSEAMVRAGASDQSNWAERLALTAVAAGASYMVLTTKHHDGFCLWPSKAASSPDNRSHTNLVEQFAGAARRHGLRWGAYYSWGEFEQSATRQYVQNVMKPQIRELIRLKPDLFWFDGDWMCTSQAAQSAIDECCALIRRQLPDAQINDRVGHRVDRQNANWLGRATYRVYDDRNLPAERPRVLWEHCNTIGLSWGRNRQQTESDYKTPAALYDLYKRVTALGGRFLINVGPEPDGSLCPIEAQRLIDFARLRSQASFRLIAMLLNDSS